MRIRLPWVLMAAFSALAAPAQDTPAQDLNQSFYTAVRNDNPAALQKLIRNTRVSALKDQRGNTPLMYAAAVGSLESMKALVDAGADVNAKNDFQVTALMLCAIEEPKVRFLLSKGSDVNARSTQGRTALLIAAGTEGASGIVRMLLDKGADLKSADADPVNTPLGAAATANDMSTVRLLLERGAATSGPAGVNALGRAAGHGNLEMMRVLLAAGVPADAPTPPSIAGRVKNGEIALGSLTPLHFAVPYGSVDAVKLLLDRKANVNAQDIRGMTPLMLALACDHPDPRVVRLLLDHGADPSLKSKSGETATDWARKFNHPEILKALNVSAHVTSAASYANPLPVRDAVQKSAGLLERTTGTFFVEGGCSACHAQNLVSMALAAAGRSGIRTASAAAASRAQQTRAFWSPQQQALMLRIDAPGGHNMTSYAALELAAEHVAPDALTDAIVHNLAAQQQLDGSWHNDGIVRPPMADGDFTNTAIAIRALSVYGPPGRKSEFSSRTGRAVAWLRDNKPVTAEDHSMQLFGLAWGGAGRDALDRAARKIVSMQRPDGGWAQTLYLASDAYATGQTLAALREAGLPATDASYRKGVDFLLRTQFPDGSWHVASRSPKFQPYFQSGFPHGHDQWISMAGTAWATMALAYALPEPQAVAAR